MRKIIIVIVIIALLVFAGTRIFARKKTAASAKPAKTAGEIKPKTKQQLEAERRQARREERRRKRELQKRLRAERKAARLARRTYGYYGYRRRYGYGAYRQARRGYRGSLSAASRIKRKTQLYQLTAIFVANDKYIALIDNQQYKVGDIIQGRKIINILSDRVVIDEYGKTKEVKIGESILPSLVLPRR
ncbi:MAG: hypothetical protein ABIK19_06745 [candidate division WOR-3 bacterium]